MAALAFAVERLTFERTVRLVTTARLRDPVLLKLVDADQIDALVEIEGAGWMVEAHLTPIGLYFDDLAELAKAYLAAPYQWGGRESAGLDCSGLVQQALYAAGRAGPRDTDMQGARVGRPVGRAELRRGDLVFWPGHVAMMIDETHILHANAHHMAVRIEPLADAIARIEAAGVGTPTGFRRV